MKNVFKVAIVEDESECVASMTAMLKRYSDEKDCVFEISVFGSIEVFMTGYSAIYDIVFMDIALPGMNGMDGAHKLRELDPVVTLIFVTSIAQFAVNGYEVSALDYILKPVSYRNFATKLDRAMAHIDKKPYKNVIIRKKQGTYRVSTNDIIYLETNGHHILFHKTDGEVIDVSGTTLSDYATQLKDSGFSCCNRCYLINMKYISNISISEVCMSDGTSLMISRGRKKAFLDDVSEFIGINSIFGGGIKNDVLQQSSQLAAFCNRACCAFSVLLF